MDSRNLREVWVHLRCLRMWAFDVCGELSEELKPQLERGAHWMCAACRRDYINFALYFVVVFFVFCDLLVPPIALLYTALHVFDTSILVSSFGHILVCGQQLVFPPKTLPLLQQR